MFLPLALFALMSSDVAAGNGFEGCAGRAGLGSGTVAHFGGSHASEESIYVLDASDPPSFLVIPKAGTPRRIGLPDPRRPLDRSGLGRAKDGSLCVLSSGGRMLLCFDPNSGVQTREQAFPSRMQGIWDVAGAMAYAAYDNESGRSLLTAEKASDTAALSPLHSRSGDNLLGRMQANLFSCGTGTADQTPCWFLEPAELMILSRDRPPLRMPVPALPGIAKQYPIRSLLLTEDILWLLVNDPPSQPALIAGEARRLVQWNRRANTVRSYSLPPRAKALIDANSRNALVLFRDGRAERCGDLRGVTP